jgi:hypothetical protein
MKAWRSGVGRLLGIAGVLALVGAAIGSDVSRPVGLPIATVGLLLLAYVGLQVALNRRGAAEDMAQRFWADQGISVPAPVLQARVIGLGMIVIGLGGAGVMVQMAVT